MRLTFLGTGCIMPQKNRLPSSYLIETGQTKILVDMGPGIYQKLFKILENPFCIDYVILTHFHQDHMSDLWPFLFGRIWGQKYFPEVKRTKIIAHNNLKDLWEQKKNCTDNWLEKVEDVDIIQMDNGVEKKENDLSIQAYSMNHKEESLGFRICVQGKTVSVSGDTGDCDNLVPLFNNADVGIIECSFGDENPLEWHLNPSVIRRLMQKIAVGKIFLSHLYPGTSELDCVKQLVNEHSNMQIAADDKKLVVNN